MHCVSLVNTLYFFKFGELDSGFCHKLLLNHFVRDIFLAKLCGNISRSSKQLLR